MFSADNLLKAYINKGNCENWCFHNIVMWVTIWGPIKISGWHTVCHQASVSVYVCLRVTGPQWTAGDNGKSWGTYKVTWLMFQLDVFLSLLFTFIKIIPNTVLPGGATGRASTERQLPLTELAGLNNAPLCSSAFWYTGKMSQMQTPQTG